MAPTPAGRAVLFSPHRRSTDPKPKDQVVAETEPVAPAPSHPWVYELRLRSVAYGTEQIAFYYESVDLFPVLRAWLQYHSCTDITQDGPYVTFRQVRAATLIESRVAVGNYFLIVAGGPLKGTVQPGDAADVARMYRIVDRTMFTGQWIDDPEQLLLQASDESMQRVLRRLIAAEGLLTRAGHEEWCDRGTHTYDSCACGYNELVKAWCETSGADPEQHLRRWQLSENRAIALPHQDALQPGPVTQRQAPLLADSPSNQAECAGQPGNAGQHGYGGQTELSRQPDLARQPDPNYQPESPLGPHPSNPGYQVYQGQSFETHLTTLAPQPTPDDPDPLIG